MKIEGKDGLGDHRTPGWIELWIPNGGQDGLCHRLSPGQLRVGVRYVRYARYVRYVRYTPLALGLSASWGLGPLCFLFSVFSSRLLPLTPRAVH